MKNCIPYKKLKMEERQLIFEKLCSDNEFKSMDEIFTKLIRKIAKQVSVFEKFDEIFSNGDLPPIKLSNAEIKSLKAGKKHGWWLDKIGGREWGAGGKDGCHWGGEKDGFKKGGLNDDAHHLGFYFSLN